MLVITIINLFFKDEFYVIFKHMVNVGLFLLTVKGIGSKEESINEK
jgi:hypothetical protein